jgi:hypothetical protein
MREAVIPSAAARLDLDLTPPSNTDCAIPLDWTVILSGAAERDVRPHERVAAPEGSITSSERSPGCRSDAGHGSFSRREPLV